MSGVELALGLETSLVGSAMGQEDTGVHDCCTAADHRRRPDLPQAAPVCAASPVIDRLCSDQAASEAELHRVPADPNPVMNRNLSIVSP